jgi:hypothetical protein
LSCASRGYGIQDWRRLSAKGAEDVVFESDAAEGMRLALDSECLENLTATAREIPRDGADSLRDTQAVCGFGYLASKLTPLFHTIHTMVAIFLARVSRAISGLIPLATKAA